MKYRNTWKITGAAKSNARRLSMRRPRPGSISSGSIPKVDLDHGEREISHDDEHRQEQGHQHCVWERECIRTSKCVRKGKHRKHRDRKFQEPSSANAIHLPIDEIAHQHAENEK